MENPFKKAVKDEKQTKEIEQDVSEQLDSSENKEVEEQQTEEVDASNAEDNTEKTEEAEEKEVNPLQEKYDTLNNQYIRLAADFENFRKRNEQEREALLKYGAENTLKKFLEVIDNFERGLKAIETVDDCEKVKECYNLAYKNFTDALTKAGLETIKAEGEEFDPNLHEAVMQTPTTEHPENTIIAELQKGYKLGDKVLRPTLVNVATEG
jgi:molecular chaperone GrpE